VTDLSRRGFLRATGLGGVALAGLVPLSACTDMRVPATPATPAGTLQRFLPGRQSGTAPGLPARVAWANTADTEIFVAIGRGVASAAKARGVEYLTAMAAGDPARNVSQIETFLGKGVGALLVQPLSQPAQRPLLERALDAGACVQGIITFPSTLQVAAPQYDIGYQQGMDAARYALRRLDGRADVCYFNMDSISPQLALRHKGVLAGLKTGGADVRVVSDLEAGAVESIETGFDTMLSVIQSHPDIAIVLGGDTVVVGAYRALQSLGKLRDDMYFAGVDGDANALDLVTQDGPYRASYAFPWDLMGYCLGQFAADWIDGLEVPRVLVAKAQPLTSPKEVAHFQDVNHNTAESFADTDVLNAYLPLLGNVGYATRDVVWDAEYEP